MMVADKFFAVFTVSVGPRICIHIQIVFGTCLLGPKVEGSSHVSFILTLKNPRTSRKVKET